MEIAIRDEYTRHKNLTITSQEEYRAARKVTMLIISIGDQMVAVLSSEVKAAIEALEEDDQR